VLRVFAWLFGPFIAGINQISNGLLRVVGLPPDLGHDKGHSAEEIRSILSLSARAGHISEQQHEITENVFRMIELEVRHIVVPRVEVHFLTADRSLAENIDRILTTGHSRFALCEVGLDSIVGIVHAKDLLDVTLRGETPNLRSLARDPLFVPDTMPLSNFLRELQAARQHCAVVVDEHGTAIGLAFREDALEEIVGPLGDEFDEEEPDITRFDDGAFELRGRVSLPEVADLLDWELPEDEREEEDTIGGHVTARLGRLPQTGDQVRIGRYMATVIDAASMRVERLRLELAEESEEVVEGD